MRLACLTVYQSRVLVSGCFLLSLLAVLPCCLSSYSAVLGSILITAWAGWWPGHQCCFCAAALDSLEFWWKLELKRLWPVDKSVWEQDTQSICAAAVVPLQGCGPRMRPRWRRWCSPGSVIGCDQWAHAWTPQSMWPWISHGIIYHLKAQNGTVDEHGGSNFLHL